MLAPVRAHARAFGDALRRLLRQPVSTALAVLSAGVALSLPAVLYALLQNFERAAAGHQGRPEMTVFLVPAATPPQAQALAGRLGAHAGVAQFRFVPKAQALADLESAGGLAEALDLLTDNPLPDAFVVIPAAAGADGAGRLADELRGWPAVERVQFDGGWARRLSALLDLGRTAVWALAAFLAVALVAVGANTTRLQVLTRRDEVEVNRLLGATDAYIRRPFWYFGLLQGLASGLAAWLLVEAFLAALAAPVADVAAAYGADFRLRSLTPPEIATLVGVAGVLGALGASAALRRHLGAHA